MANSNPPGKRPPHLRDDEPIALLVAFLAFGAIGLWSFNEYQNGRFNLAFFQPQSSPSPVAKVTVSPTPFLPPLPQAEPRKIETKISPERSLHSTKSTLNPKNAQTTEIQEEELVTAAPIAASVAAPIAAASVVAPVFFTDVPKTHWAYGSIKALADLKLAEGFPDNTYHPDLPITRSTYAALIEKAFEKPEQSTTIAFKDVKAGNQQSQIVSKAVKSNFMTGYPKQTFKPDQPISRTEAIVAMVKGLGLQTPADPETVLKQYQDNQSIPKWARPKVAAAVASGLLGAYPNPDQLHPQQRATRADVAALIVKGLEVDKK